MAGWCCDSDKSSGMVAWCGVMVTWDRGGMVVYGMENVTTNSSTAANAAINTTNPITASTTAALETGHWNLQTQRQWEEYSKRTHPAAQEMLCRGKQASVKSGPWLKGASN
ncbi:hypothetical protein H920_06147 [Fukomys damarensis]|uniref:Uncharacterized protein n=1 Tax=Fukomys damarensis TaxID=885580 RepID=A0A091DPP1_FUKDA|nr:hypothetical protein H920_06147 [Fukomys damarensis]